jgi:hypothetical protein
MARGEVAPSHKKYYVRYDMEVFHIVLDIIYLIGRK